jgi:RNA polymerase sigma-70 factor, ECF subfamily
VPSAAHGHTMPVGQTSNVPGGRRDDSRHAHQNWNADQLRPMLAASMTHRADSTEYESGMEPTVSSSELQDLYEAHGTVLLKYLIRFTHGDRHRAEDILQETLLRAWHHPEARRMDGRWSRPWLFTVARRIAIDHFRLASTRPIEVRDDDLDERPMPKDDVERMIDAAEVRAALESLPHRLRSVLIEIYFRERSISETAEKFGVPVGTIKSRTFYALRALRKALVARGFPLQPL